MDTLLCCLYLQLLDEMIDNGFPLTTEPNILRDIIAPPNIVSKVLSVVTGNSSNVSETLPGATSFVPWRTTDAKYSNNEVYVDLVEEMDATINRYEIKYALKPGDFDKRLRFLVLDYQKIRNIIFDGILSI